MYLVDFLELHVYFLEILGIQRLACFGSKENGGQNKYLLGEKQLIER